MSENTTVNVASCWDVAERLADALRLPFAPDEAAIPGFGTRSEYRSRRLTR